MSKNEEKIKSPHISMPGVDILTKKIMDGKMYNTETAEALGHKHWIDEETKHLQTKTIYRKKTGEFFLKYHGVIEGELFQDLFKISDENAKLELESMLCPEHYIELFGEVEE